MANRDSTPEESHLVFIHGGGVGPWMWRQQRQHFGGCFVVHTPALPGHEIGSDLAYSSNAAAARHVADQVDLTVLRGEVTVVGFSIGGQVAIELASLFPDRISRAVVVSSIVSPWRSAGLLAWVAGVAAPLARVERFARAQARELFVPSEDFDSYFALSRFITKETLVAVMRANLSFRPPEEFLTSERPTLFVAGSKEQRRLIWDLARLGDALPGAGFELIEGVAHGAPLGAPAEFNRVLDEWLSGRSGARSRDRRERGRE